MYAKLPRKQVQALLEAIDVPHDELVCHRDGTFTISLAVAVPAALRAEQSGLFHQATRQEAAHRNTLYSQRRRQCSGSS